MRARPPPPVILTAVSAFQRRASAHFLRRPRTGKIAMSVITRAYAEKAAQRNGSVQVFPSRFVHGRFTQFIAISLVSIRSVPRRVHSRGLGRRGSRPGSALWI